MCNEPILLRVNCHYPTHRVDICICDQTANVALAQIAIALLQVHIRDSHQTCTLLVDNLLPRFQFGHDFFVCQESEGEGIAFDLVGAVYRIRQSVLLKQGRYTPRTYDV